MVGGQKRLKQKTGEIGESIAEQFLKRKGYAIIAKNYRRPWGEIDIIAEKDGVVRFIEVKTVSDNTHRHHNPEEMVDRRKLAKLARTAALYMESARDRREYQLDVVGVIADFGTRTARCRLFEQVLESL